ncbi:hypothetical protein L2E82_16417 [Cichorium intybus]|uniref:Uncharacterized protein n=1 Tax=Cichorium intybus TaxID=13427 RepID=A0ACB9F6S4_CICIN|nr:hypothetical protein L2E82_16417 [Cichorium intybus]
MVKTQEQKNSPPILVVCLFWWNISQHIIVSSSGVYLDFFNGGVRRCFPTLYMVSRYLHVCFRRPSKPLAGTVFFLKKTQSVGQKEVAGRDRMQQFLRRRWIDVVAMRVWYYKPHHFIGAMRRVL